MMTNIEGKAAQPAAKTANAKPARGTSHSDAGGRPSPKVFAGYGA